MSGSVPVGPIVNADGTMTEPMRQLLQALVQATGYPFEIQVRRVSDTSVKIRQRDADGVWRESAAITLT